MIYETQLQRHVGRFGRTWVRARFGLHAIGEQAPYLSLTGEEYKRPEPSDRNLIACGQMHDTVVAAFPKLQPLVKWHLSTDGIPMHYRANAKYWHEMANGKVERRPHDPEPRATFASHVVLGALADDPKLDRLLEIPWEDCLMILASRERGLRLAFKREVLDALPTLVTELGATLA